MRDLTELNDERLRDIIAKPMIDLLHPDMRPLAKKLLDLRTKVHKLKAHAEIVGGVSSGCDGCGQCKEILESIFRELP